MVQIHDFCCKLRIFAPFLKLFDQKLRDRTFSLAATECIGNGALDY
ncbi:hypothetical protein [Nostoc sp.]